ncbi:EthD family reductase [Snuella sedimenti]|uniref:EthD family reductase n=1 Tax=Snuella sedimenti TaxID=2798802 RepID=A0A8J7IHA8_9FLAO|nr:EthD family reductase [Snuella sedimenti]MBJ6367816.1 EthD family reductase [Snuella sedimenti]
MKKGAIKVSVLYPNKNGKTFDMDYYCNKHVPMVAGLLGDDVIGASVEKGLGGGAPDQEATYIAMGNLYFESMASFENAFGPNADKIMGDIPNYTNIEPVIQISEVMI